MRLGVEGYDGIPDEHEVPGPEWLRRNRAVARRMLQLLPGDGGADEAILMAGPVAWGLRGRWHWWSPDVLLDCAHNVEGLTATGKALQELGRPIHLVFAAVADKDIPAALACLPPVQAHYWCAADVPRAMPVEQLAEQAANVDRSGVAYSSVGEALRAAREKAQSQGELTVVLGSVFTVGEALTALDNPSS